MASTMIAPATAPGKAEDYCQPYRRKPLKKGRGTKRFYYPAQAATQNSRKHAT